MVILTPIVLMVGTLILVLKLLKDVDLPLFIQITAGIPAQLEKMNLISKCLPDFLKLRVEIVMPLTLNLLLGIVIVTHQEIIVLAIS